MINTITARVIGAMRYKMDNGVTGAKLTIMNEASPDNENRLGHDVATISAPYDLFDQLAPMAAHMPCTVEIDAEMRASGGKITMHAIAVRRPSATGHAAPSQPATEKAK